jgi:hypothetical protein
MRLFTFERARSRQNAAKISRHERKIQPDERREKVILREDGSIIFKQ